MPSLFDGIYGTETVNEIYDKIQANYPGFPLSRSDKLWLLRRECGICHDNRSPETMLEKAVAMLAKRGHMPGWYNQCPVASGIVGSHSDRRSDVDLVNCSESRKNVRLVELKWGSDNPMSALQQILRYGVAYIFCRVHRQELPLHYRSLMDARQVSLEVVAPCQYYYGEHSVSRRFDVYAWLDRFGPGDPNRSSVVDSDRIEIADYLAKTSQSLDEFARSKTDGSLTMSLNGLAFPEEFNKIPFENGQDVRKKCSTKELSAEGRMVRDAFAGLTPVLSQS
ncbi:MAG: hypothetical protein OXG26_10785 [Caldilineaceae bacterium]|nr:hypothetical protein [Caldilineaceae bacterium]